MNCCNKRWITIVTLVIAIVIFIQTNLLTFMVFSLKGINEDFKSVAISKTLEDKTLTDSTNEEWKLIIPKINVSAEIEEGTGEETINNSIGHFEETPKNDGNIGLIAACAGYKENYFENLKDLVSGDVIIYVNGTNRKEYKVVSNNIISQTDWSYLSSTSDNRITLITGIVEKPENRRCVQAVEII